MPTATANGSTAAWNKRKALRVKRAMADMTMIHGGGSRAARAAEFKGAGFYDRAKQDVGNIVSFEHLNVEVPDQQLATSFYVTAMGFTRDPYIITALSNMWINIGRTQVHMPVGDPMVLRGHTGIIVPDLDALAKRLETVKMRPEWSLLKKSKFKWQRGRGFIEAVCPWGNVYRCYQAGPQHKPLTLAILYIEFDVPTGTADGIARFYREALQAKAAARGGVARVDCSGGQSMVFRETARKLPLYDGHHVQVYIANFSGPHNWLLDRGLVTEESDDWQYRFEDIIDPKTGEKLFMIEHEIRSMTHPLYARGLVNRDPFTTNRNYVPMHEALTWTAR